MKNKRLSRRLLLRGLGLGAGMLPFVPLLDVHAETVAPPRRLVFLYNSNGTVHESWLPSMSGGQLLLSPILSPLEAFKSRLLVVDGLEHRVILEKGQATGHYAGINTVLTGRMAQQIDPNEPARSMATGISIDRYLAPVIGADTKLSTIECGVQVDEDPAVAALSYSGALQPIMADNSPYSVFERVFSGFTQPGTVQDPAAAERLADRKSVLDAVSKNLASVRGRLPQSDRVKLDVHLDGVRALEQSLTTGVGIAATDSCAVPNPGEPLAIWSNDNIPALAKLQMDLLVMAMACDLTRVGTIQFGRAGAQHRFNWLGSEFATDPALPNGDGTSGIHALAHDELNPTSRAKLVKIHAWYAGQLAYLLGKLAAIPEGTGSMLDNTLVVWINELGTGNHGHKQLPFVIAGNVGGFFKTGQSVSFPGQPHNRLLLSICHAMGLDDTSFGDPDYCSAGPLTGVTA